MYSLALRRVLSHYRSVINCWVAINSRAGVVCCGGRGDHCRPHLVFGASCSVVSYVSHSVYIMG